VIMPLAGHGAAAQDRGDTLNDVDINHQQDEMTST
jgi:hypothetical protein